MLREILEPWFQLEPAQWSALESHYQLLCRWNKVLNLTRIDSPEEAAIRHYGESLFLARHLPEGTLRLGDIGSGPGFPGFPVAVARPECSVALIESHQRKSVFLREATRGMQNIRVVARRAEDVLEPFDWVISRAVSYSGLAGTLGRLASRAALLTGLEEPPDSLASSWDPPIPLPWGKRRFLRLGRTTNA